MNGHARARLRFGFLLVCCLLFARFAFADTVVVNSPPWDGLSSAPLWGGGPDYVPTFGQTFTVPAADLLLTNFSVRLLLFPSPLNFSAQILAWDESLMRPVGLPLYNESFSKTRTTPGQYELVSFNPNVQLNPGSSYVFQFSTLGKDNTALLNFFTSFAASTPDSYSGGKWVFSAYGAGNELATPVSGLTGVTWGSKGQCDAFGTFICMSPQPNSSDLIFSATFTSVPETTSATYIAAALLLVGLLWSDPIQHRRHHPSS